MDLENDDLLLDLSEEIDGALLEWIQTYDLHPLNLSAIILARLTRMAKETGNEDDYIKLLEHPKEIIYQDDTKDILH
jgi:hypothetical protein